MLKKLRENFDGFFKDSLDKFMYGALVVIAFAFALSVACMVFILSPLAFFVILLGLFLSYIIGHFIVTRL